MKEHIEKLNKHKNALYAIVIILLIFQAGSFLALSLQASKLNSQVDNYKISLENEIKMSNESYSKLLNDYTLQNRQNFNEISQALTNQKNSFDSQITLLKISQADFSSIINNSIKSVVSVGTDKEQGTGFFVNSKGYIVTNQHVIANANQIGVLTYDKKIIPAALISSDSLRDLALLKIDGTYDYLSFDNSDNIQLGDKVIAVGNPLGLSFSVTEGIISAFHRTGPNGLSQYIQTDVPLNPGNSGGPLIDTSGKIIGINNFKVGNAENIGFSLESNVIKQVVNEMTNQTIIE